MKKIFVLHVPEQLLLSFGRFIASHEIWTLFSYQMEGGFFSPKITCVWVCLQAGDEDKLKEKEALLRSKFSNEIKTETNL
jgi:hypothetical protein